MEMKDQNVTKSTSQSRRKFLMRTGVGLVVASLPARSVWAGSGGIAQSIVASGHGSDFANGHAIKLESHGYFKNSQTAHNDATFMSVFGHPPFCQNGFPVDPSSPLYSATLGQILNNPGNGPTGMGGNGNINIQLITLYLNAYFSFHGDSKIYYPIVGFDKPFTDLNAFASYLYKEARDNGPGVYSAALSDLIDSTKLK